MYKTFNLKISNNFYESELKRYLERGKEIYEKYESIAKKSLNEFIYKNGHIDGTSMRSNWFQMEDVDIFISHSHQDIVEVKAFAGWLYEEFDLKVFIDSCAWGYCDELLKQIDDNYCIHESGEMYDYELRNYTTSHVHMMLASALAEMIDRTECIMFYNTPNSVSLVNNLNTIREERKKVTLSPWIYHELSMTSMVRICEPDRTSPLLENVIAHRSYGKKHDINIEYDVDEYLEEMIPVTSKELISWRDIYTALTDEYLYNNRYIGGHKDIYPLDVLYDLPRLSNFM